VQTDTLKPGQSFEVSDEYGKELIEKLPKLVSEDPPKAEPAPQNKKEPTPKSTGSTK
jgi:hypothetical protein